MVGPPPLDGFLLWGLSLVLETSLMGAVALFFGLALATGSSLAYENGKTVPQRLAGLSLPTLADCPEIVIEFLASDAPPFDPGELGVAVAPPAIANALYSATGVRFRRLPLLSEGL